MAELQVSGIAKSYGTKQVLEPTDLTVADGELCALLGSSGSGKSTLLRIVAGLTAPDAGVVRIAGQDVTRWGPAKRNIGFVFQSYALFPHMSVGNNVAFGLRGTGSDRRTIRRAVGEMLELVGLDGYAHLRPPQLSGGQQQRVALARALVTRPNILLLDEPLSALDRKIRGELQQELKRVHQETKLTTIMVTHDQDEAMGLSTKVVMLDKGQVQQQGAPRDLILNPSNHFVADFLGAEGLGTGRAATRDGFFGVQFDNLWLRCSGAGLADGTRVEVLVHADSVAVTPAQATPPTHRDATTAEGVLERLEVVGRSTRCIVRIGTIGIPSVIPARAAWDLREGDHVLATVDPHGVHAFLIDGMGSSTTWSEPLSGAVAPG